MVQPPLPSMVATIASAWACEPAAFSRTRRCGMLLSVLQGDASAAQEASAEASADYHTLCFPLRRYASEVALDGRRSATSAVRPGDLCLVAARRQPWGVNFGPWRSLHVYVPDQLVAEVLEAEEVGVASADVDFGGPSGVRDRDVERLCLALLDEMGGGRPFSRLRLDCLAQDLAIGLMRARVRHPHGGEGATRSSSGGLAPWRLNRAREAMADGHAVSLADLARDAGCSTTHFRRAFKQSTGLSPSTWMHRQRFARAEALLSEPGLALAEIALEVGFSSQSHFTAAFRSATGQTPGAWRRERLR